MPTKLCITFSPKWYQLLYFNLHGFELLMGRSWGWNGISPHCAALRFWTCAFQLTNSASLPLSHCTNSTKFSKTNVICTICISKLKLKNQTRKNVHNAQHISFLNPEYATYNVYYNKLYSNKLQLKAASAHSCIGIQPSQMDIECKCNRIFDLDK